jgi:excisionase family DNA binding protein
VDTTTPKPGSTAHAARRIGVSIPTVYRLIHEGHLRAFKIGRATRISDEAIADCIKVLERDQPFPSGGAAP